jgi:hypothetical protein
MGAETKLKFLTKRHWGCSRWALGSTRTAPILISNKEAVMHGMCFNEGNSGNCGFNCRAFTSSDCQIADEMIFNSKITYSDYLDAIELYPHLAVTGVEMKRITDLMLEKMAEHNKQMSVLIAITQIPWENLKVDEVICVSDDLNKFIAGDHGVVHFRGLEGNGLVSAYRSGKSSATNTDNYFDNWKYALPIEVYKRMNGSN